VDQRERFEQPVRLIDRVHAHQGGTLSAFLICLPGGKCIERFRLGLAFLGLDVLPLLSWISVLTALP
jgi:hypothetical protein